MKVQLAPTSLHEWIGWIGAYLWLGYQLAHFLMGVL